ncbi:hypothetical protein C8J27_10987 [Rhodobacter aestuarii]|uniref:CAAX prenyl protease 2/Lysostaphin resistance protein A-like domain-containing protein n=1 Tax=Rhodobacter aestuarii TaxID=453582 RepID=A0A1N7PSX5_9RHOB|nr:CPBP family intramembrane glutamic endopeptidase [Rhodobacter aestuarii]PTV94189.1 hypothetical protein C8J27_10987 [Rhodobacter aestuarii]SIT13708.1 hypothetical protein SAMN05421580_11148 [Rhodobacter aestuarii]
MTYPLLDRYVASAKPSAEAWRVLVGLGLIGGFYFGALLGGMSAVGALFGPQTMSWVIRNMNAANTPVGLVMLLFSFAPLLLGTMLITRLLHNRPVLSLFGVGAGRDFALVFPALVLAALLIAPLSGLDPHLAKSTSLSVMLAWLPLSLPLLFVQIASEELLFRGYVLQQIAARTRWRVLWMGIPAALFGALHYAPDMNGPVAIYVALWATAFGVLAADLTARAGNLGPALAFHLANNISAVLLVGIYGQLDGLSLYTLVINTRDPAEMAPYLAMDSLSMLVFWLLARLMLRR